MAQAETFPVDVVSFEVNPSVARKCLRSNNPTDAEPVIDGFALRTQINVTRSASPPDVRPGSAAPFSSPAARALPLLQALP
jgi:hypothetical protein